MILVIQSPQPLGVSRIRLSEVIVRKLLQAMFIVLALILSSSPDLGTLSLVYHDIRKFFTAL
jgi:hypothetical protein